MGIGHRLLSGIVVFFCAIAPLMAQIVDKTNCTQAKCHASIIDRRYLHDPVEEDCQSCHDGEVENHPDGPGAEFQLSDPVPDLCFGCHDENNTKAVVHDPVAEGSCTDCHNPHGEANKFFFSEQRIDSLCAECHDLDFTRGAHPHQPVEKGECTSCHNPHESASSALLQKPLPDLCFSCHEQIAQQYSASVLHPPFEEDCLNCHQVHAAPRKKLLDEEVPALCYECHDDIQELIENRPVKHQPVSEGKSCLQCHSPHGTNLEALLKNPQEKLCLTCHNKPIETGEATLANIAVRLEGNMQIHDPVRLEGCTICHNPHAAQFSRLLENQFRTQRYVDGSQTENFSLCFDCHNEEKILLPRTTDDTITRFRDGDRNLHYLHVNRQKGRNCINCHDVHGAENPRLIPVHVPFGQWPMPLHFQLRSDGGSCTPGCHEKKSYRR